MRGHILRVERQRLFILGDGVPQDALSDAYAYLGAIGGADGRATRVAALLYPGRGAAEVYRSGTGAVPLLPGATSELTTLLAAWTAPDAAFPTTTANR